MKCDELMRIANNDAECAMELTSAKSKRNFIAILP